MGNFFSTKKENYVSSAYGETLKKSMSVIIPKIKRLSLIIKEDLYDENKSQIAFGLKDLPSAELFVNYFSKADGIWDNHTERAKYLSTELSNFEKAYPFLFHIYYFQTMVYVIIHKYYNLTDVAPLERLHFDVIKKFLDYYIIKDKEYDDFIETIIVESEMKTVGRPDTSQSFGFSDTVTTQSNGQRKVNRNVVLNVDENKLCREEAKKMAEELIKDMKICHQKIIELLQKRNNLSKR